MAITTLGAIAIGAGALGSAALNKSASNKAASAATQAADASAAEQRAARDQAYSTLNPFVNSGTAASSQINALLGLNTGTQTVTSGTPNYSQYVQSNPDLMAEYGRVSGQFGNDMNAYGQYHYNTYGQGEGRTLPGQTTTNVTPTSAQGAFDNFRNSTGYQFRLGEGVNALNSQYAGAGAIKSGAAMKGITEYGQNFASNEFGNYLNALGNQQATGLQAGSAAAGVGVNAANSLGNIYQNRADAVGNAALTNASNMNSLIGTLGAGILKYG